MQAQRQFSIPVCLRGLLLFRVSVDAGHGVDRVRKLRELVLLFLLLSTLVTGTAQVCMPPAPDVNFSTELSVCVSCNDPVVLVLDAFSAVPV